MIGCGIKIEHSSCYTGCSWSALMDNGELNVLNEQSNVCACVSFTFTHLSVCCLSINSFLNVLVILHSPTAVRFNNRKHTVEPLITSIQLCDPLHGDHYITAPLLSAEHLFLKNFLHIPLDSALHQL